MTNLLTKYGAFSHVWLMEQEFPPTRYVVPGLVPEGLTLLVAPPKTGKSWMVLDVAHQAATGGKAFGCIPMERARPVLYLALEDGKGRLQRRLKVLEATVPTPMLFFATSVVRADILGVIAEFMQDFTGQDPLVILDTLGKVMPPAQPGETDYARDYRIGSSLKDIADANPGSAVIVVHHTRKAASDDFLDAVSGTQGLAGSADSILVLRRQRASSSGTLSVTSRDAMEGEYAVDLQDARWQLVGDGLRAAADALKEHRATARLSERSVEVVRLVNQHPAGLRAKDIAEALGMDAKDAGTYLHRAEESGHIERRERGLYGPFPQSSVGSVGSVGNLIALPTHPTLPTGSDDGDD